MTPISDIDDLLADPILRSLAPARLTEHAAAAMAMSGQPTGLCGHKWIETGDPTCIVCDGTGGIAGACRCPCGGVAE